MRQYDGVRRMDDFFEDEMGEFFLMEMMEEEEEEEKQKSDTSSNYDEMRG